MLSFDNAIGSWRLSQIEDIAYPKPKLIEKLKLKLKLPIYEINKLDIIDEFNRYDICHTIEPHKQVMIKANTPGCGKSYICEGIIELGYNLVFVCPIY